MTLQVQLCDLVAPLVGSSWNCIKCIEILAGAQLEPVLSDQRSYLNFLNSASTHILEIQTFLFLLTTL